MSITSAYSTKQNKLANTNSKPLVESTIPCKSPIPAQNPLPPAMTSLDSLIPPQNFHFEESLLADPDNESLWLDYVELVQGDTLRSRFVLDRAVARLPASSLLWNAYFLLPWPDHEISTQIAIYKKALVVLGSSPSIWMRYLRLLVDSRSETAKSAFDTALFNLDFQYHAPVWKLYLDHADRVGGAGAAQVYCRYASVCGDFPDGPSLDEVVLRIAQHDASLATKVFPKLWTSLRLSQLLSLAVVEFCAVFRSGSFHNDEYYESLVEDAVCSFPDLAADFYGHLALYYQKWGSTEKASHAFSRGIRAAVLVDQVTLLFDRFSDHLEQSLATDSPARCSHQLDVLERFLADRPLYVNDVKLKQNVNLVDVWLERIETLQALHRSQDMLACYVRAISSVNPLKSVSSHGKTLASLWIDYANVYIAQGDFSTAHLIFSRAIKSQFKSVDELAEIHIAWAELMLEKSDDDALQHISGLLKESDSPLQQQLAASPKLWEFRMDLLKAMASSDNSDSALQNPEIVLGDMVRTKAVTLSILLDYAAYLKEEKRWDAYFSALSIGLSAFVLPEAKYEIWKVYLPAFLAVNSSVDRVRETYAKCIAQIPPFCAKEYYVQFSEFEKSNSVLVLLRILKQAIASLTDAYNDTTTAYTKKQRNVMADDKFDLYNRELDLISHHLNDVEMAREEYTRAVEDPHLTTPNTVDLSLRFVRFETANKEYARVRALYKYTTGLARPDWHMMEPVWKNWEEFELEHGTEKTYKKMLLRKREVAQSFDALDEAKSAVNPMGFTKAETTVLANPDAIDLDMDM